MIISTLFLSLNKWENVMSMAKNEIVVQEYINQYVNISNTLIRARERTSVLESKIEVLAIHHMDKKVKLREKKDTQGNTYVIKYVELNASEIKKLMGKDYGEIYSEIYRAAMALKEKLYIYEDREAKSFMMKSMYENVSYDNGTLTIEFNPEMEEYYTNLKENYTKLSLPIFFSFRKNGGLQLYKLLKSFAYNLPKIDLSLDQENLPVFSVYFDLIELRMILGYIDISQEKLKKEGRKRKPNFDKMAEDEINPQYKRWSDFSARVIMPGIKEVNDISDIYIFEMKKKLTGKGGKVTGLTFYIQHNKNFYQNKKISNKNKSETTEKNIQSFTDESIFDFVDEIRGIISCELKTKDYLAIAKAANYDIQKVKMANAAMEAYSSNINNVAGFLIAAIQKDYTVTSYEKKKINRIKPHERQYSIDDYLNLEKMMLNNDNIDDIDDTMNEDDLLKEFKS